MLDARENIIAAAIKAGGLVRYQVRLEEGQLDQRQLWVRPEIGELVASDRLDPHQREVVKAALKRFVVGGTLAVVTKDCTHKEVAALGDIRELEGYTPPFVELRFKPPKHDLRFFGRCIGRDRLILTSYGLKSLMKITHEKPLSIPEQCKRCDAFFRIYHFEQVWVPATMTESFSNAEFV
jgi:hypothetical protein